MAFDVLCILVFLVSASVSGNNQCGYEECPLGKPGFLNVHLVPHTHDDVGWLKTVDQYYYGARNDIQRAGVQYILDTVIPELVADKSKKFIYVETAFFWKWWKEQSDSLKAVVKDLVNQGRLEFIGGGWTMNDEGAAHYNTIIDQMTLGHKTLLNIFGPCAIPKIGWQIDPFGHSREQALLFAKMGFDGYFFGRLDWNDKGKRANNKTMEFVWKGSDEMHAAGEIFTGVLPNGYNPPTGFCFDDTCADTPIMDDPESVEYNVDQKIDAFINASYDEAKMYATDHIIMTMGSDFQYQNARTWYKNLDKLIKYVNQRQANGSKVNAFYSTPSCYLYSLNKANKTWSMKSDDFFPYASDPHAFWTGYFSSRPSQKGYIRYSNNILQAVKQLQVIFGLHDSKTRSQVRVLKEAVAINTHHDAITGTEKQHVANNYDLLLYRGVQKGFSVIGEVYKEVIYKGHGPDQHFCLNLNISECSITESKEPITLKIYNPTAYNYSYTVRLPCVGSGYRVVDSSGRSLSTQIAQIPDYVQNIPGRKSAAQHELVFRADLPPLGYTTYIIRPSSVYQGNNLQRLIPKGREVLANASDFVVAFDADTGSILRITLNSGEEIQLKQSLKWYTGMNGNNKHFNNRASGAYIFRPNGTKPHDFETPKASFYTSDTLTEVHQVYNSWIGQTIRVYRQEDSVQFDWVVGPIPVEDKIGKEIVSVVETNLTSNKTFYTDSNGRQMLKRIRDYRPTWEYMVTEPVSGNYYPVNSRIYIRDEQKGVQVTLLTDRSEGGSSLSDGQLELMVHRRLLHDDAFGVGEPLNETGVDGRGLVVRGSHYLIPSKIETSARKHRQSAVKLYLAPILAFSNCTGKEDNVTKQWSALVKALPPNVHLLTLEQWSDDLVLLRLEHLYESNEDSKYSNSVRLDLRKLFANMRVVGAREATLTANQFVHDLQRLKWRTEEKDHDDDEHAEDHRYNTVEDRFTQNLHDFVVTLKPMQIRTFLVRVVAR